jgi:PAS domain S-box-containing protein
MYNLNAYDNAIAKYHEEMSCNVMPIISWDFHHDFLKDLKSDFSDFQKVNVIASQYNWDTSDFDVLERLKEEVVIITDLEQRILFTSGGILNMTGYSEAEVLGKSPKMFQGIETCLITRAEIRLAIESEESVKKTIINYKKNGETYLCTINVFPVFNLKGKLTHFIAFEKAA